MTHHLVVPLKSKGLVQVVVVILSVYVHCQANCVNVAAFHPVLQLIDEVPAARESPVVS